MRIRRKRSRKERKWHRSWFGRIKLYLSFAFLVWLFKNDYVTDFFNNGYFTVSILGVIVFWFIVAAVATIIGWNRRKQSGERQEDKDGLFL